MDQYKSNYKLREREHLYSKLKRTYRMGMGMGIDIQKCCGRCARVRLCMWIGRYFTCFHLYHINNT